MDSHPNFDISGQGKRFDSAQDVAEIVADLARLPVHLNEVNLSGNSFGVDASKAVSAILASKKTIKIANFQDMFTGRLRSETPESLLALTAALIHVDVEKLILSDNAFGPAGAEPLIGFLSTTTTLRHLELNNNGLGVQGGRCIAKALDMLAEKNEKENRAPTLISFSAGRNRLEDGAAPHLGKALARHMSLEVVCLPQNGIRAPGITALAEALAGCKGLRVIDLQDNTLTRSGAKAMARALPSWPSLRTLNLNDCLLGACGCSRILQALLRNRISSLSVLQLAYNEMDSSSCKILAEWFEKCGVTALTRLEVNGNSFSAEDESVSKIMNIIEENDNRCEMDELDDVYSEEEKTSETSESDEHPSYYTAKEGDLDNESDWEHIQHESRKKEDEDEDSLSKNIAKLSIN